MDNQKDRARQAGKFIKDEDSVEWNIISDKESSVFKGYDTTTETNSLILKYRKLSDHYEYVLSTTPFYAESGGQVGDKGKIYNDLIELNIIDTVKLNDDIIHISSDFNDRLIDNNKVTCKVKSNRRNRIKANHTATHLLY